MEPLKGRAMGYLGFFQGGGGGGILSFGLYCQTPVQGVDFVLATQKLVPVSVSVSDSEMT